MLGKGKVPDTAVSPKSFVQRCTKHRKEYCVEHGKEMNEITVPEKQQRPQMISPSQSSAPPRKAAVAANDQPQPIERGNYCSGMSAWSYLKFVDNKCAVMI